MRTRSLLVLAVALLVAACQTQKIYQVERSRTYAQDKQAVWDRLLAFLERNQIAVTSADLASGRIAAERRDFEDQGWADCERRRVYESSGGGSRMSWALRVDRDLALQVDVAENAGATAGERRRELRRGADQRRVVRALHAALPVHRARWSALCSTHWATRSRPVRRRMRRRTEAIA